MSIDPKKIAEWKETASFVEAKGSASESELRLLAAAGIVLLAEREEMLALLREAANPQPPRFDSGAFIVSGCAFCAGHDGEHAYDCRLAAFLKES